MGRMLAQQETAMAINKKTIISLIILLILLISLPLVMYLVKNPQIFRSRATTNLETKINTTSGLMNDINRIKNYSSIETRNENGTSTVYVNGVPYLATAREIGQRLQTFSTEITDDQLRIYSQQLINVQDHTQIPSIINAADQYLQTLLNVFRAQLLASSPSPSPSPSPGTSPSPGPVVINGDLDNNRCIDMRDYEFWQRKYPNPAGNQQAFEEYQGWLQKFNANANPCP